MMLAINVRETLFIWMFHFEFKGKNGSAMAMKRSEKKTKVNLDIHEPDPHLDVLVSWIWTTPIARVRVAFRWNENNGWHSFHFMVNIKYYEVKRWR